MNQPHAAYPGRPRVVRWTVILMLGNVVVDFVVVAPLVFLPQIMAAYDTDQAAWITATAFVGGVIWAPLLGKAGDVFGKRRVLVVTLRIALVGALICYVAPNIVLLVLGRVVQAAAVGALFLSVALAREITPPGVGRTVVGVVVSGSSIFGIATPLLVGYAVAGLGVRIIFVVSAVLAGVVAVLTRAQLPESPVRAGGRVDVVGALLLGVGLASAMGYLSLGPDLGWTSAGMLGLLVGSIVALVAWVFTALRLPEPAVDVRAFSRPLVLMLVVLLLATGGFLAVQQTISLFAQVSPDAGLGYGLGLTETTVGLLFAAPPLGILVGGTLAGWLASRTGSAWPLLGGVVAGTVGVTVGVLFATTSFPGALVCLALLGISSGATLTSAFNLAMDISPVDRHGVVSSLVTVNTGLGGVVLTFVGALVLRTTATRSDGGPVNSSAGILTTLTLFGALFALASLLTVVLVRMRRSGVPEVGTVSVAG